MQAFAAQTGHFPKVVVLQNHGIFIAADSEQEIRDIYARIMDRLECEYAILGIADEHLESPAPSPEDHEAMRELIQEISGESLSVVAGPLVDVPHGPLTPDHIVYAKSYALTGSVDRAAYNAFRLKHGYAPTVIKTANGIFGVGANLKDAGLALTFARDGALVQQLAAAFGGASYLSDASRKFIEQWEVEAYRKQIAI